jgi:hypothetical protein
MALLDILKLVASDEGINIDDAGEKTSVITFVNKAAQEIYDQEDFPESLDEDTFDIDISSQIIALPWYAEHIRGWRFQDARIQGSVADKRNRYQDGIGNEVWQTRWRHKKHSALQRELTNESVLKVSVPIAETSTVTIDIIGTTSNSSNSKESLVFTPGDLTKTSVGNYKEPILTIRKDRATNYDFTVKDVNDNVVAVIPNHRNEAKYRIIQILDCDAFSFTSTMSTVEILYKKRFNPLVNDSDEFLGGDKFDMAVFWRYKEHRSEDVEKAVAFATKVDEVLSKITSNEQMGTRRAIGFVRNPYFNMPYHGKVPPRRYYGFPGYIQ